MANRFTRIIRGARLLIGDALAREAAERNRRVPAIVRTSKGPAIGLDGQAYALRIPNWDTDMAPEVKRARITAALAEAKNLGMVA